MSQPKALITQHLEKFRNGDAQALQDLFPLVYAELRKMAGGIMLRENSGHTLQPTVLVHEVFVKLTDGAAVNFQDRAHFFAVAAQVMRRVLIDAARAKKAEKRGGGGKKVEFEEAIHIGENRGPDLVALDDALLALAIEDENLSRLVEMRYFGGMTIEEIAEVLGNSPATVKREWSRAKLWLYRELKA
jgi:RNA polymerase sigma factor (TIGR02999 family)